MLGAGPVGCREGGGAAGLGDPKDTGAEGGSGLGTEGELKGPLLNEGEKFGEDMGAGRGPCEDPNN